jgi:hypothetical protein
MIVRDEAATLEGCLRSLVGLADEVVVVDTGSADGTPELAARLGARVFAFPWGGDFAAARNEALRHVRGRFVLYVDADERVVSFPRGAPRDALLADASVVAYTVRFRPRSGFTRYREHRIFRHDPRIRFRGVIHETMLPDVQRVARADRLRIAPSTVAIDHLGYDGDQLRKRLRDVPLLRARLAATPEHVYSWNHLGHALEDLGDRAGARDAWQRGVEAVRRKPAPGPPDSLPYVALVQRDLADGGNPAALLEEALRRFPGNHLVTWVRARTLMARGRFAEARPLLAGLAAIDPEAVEDPIAYDARIFGRWAVAALALCCFRLGAYAASARHYARAEALAPDDPGFRARRLLAEARAAASGEAAAAPADRSPAG